MYALEQSAVESAAAAASSKAKTASCPEDGELEAPDDLVSLPRNLEKEVVYSAAHRGKIAVPSHLDSAAHREALERAQKLRLKQKDR